MRKPISVSVSSYNVNCDGLDDGCKTIVVVCDDGSIWRQEYDYSGVRYGRNPISSWIRLDDIPQD